MDDQDRAHMQNKQWKSYRIKGTNLHKYALPAAHKGDNPPPPPSPNRNTPRFFEGRRWTPYAYWVRLKSSTLPERATPYDARFHLRAAHAQAQYQQAIVHFGPPRYDVVRTLGIGGYGLAIHFRDRGSGGPNETGRDIVIKMALDGWTHDSTVIEKRMLRKVQGSAHCVQIIDPQDIGQPEEEPGLVPLDTCDSSTDHESSGNESLNRAEVRKRHRVRKRSLRTRLQAERKRRRWIERQNEIDAEILQRKARGFRSDYIVMEYLQHGSLATLMGKLSDREPRDKKHLRIPNRVLWGFWLCLIRACIAMEYPPRKFHPLRKKPEKPEGAIPYMQAKANGMIRECKRLGLKFFDPDKYAQMEAEHKQLEGDLIENLPNANGNKSDDWKLERRQNMIHRDIDPTNIFVHGFELDDTALLQWQQTRAKSSDIIDPIDPNKSEAKWKEDELNFTKRRPDRACREHELIPRLKLGDFGLAVCVKREKSNEYYRHHRIAAKHGDHPPESFGPEWEAIDLDPAGHQLADSRTCGYYSYKTNIWSIGLTMWQLITRYNPPIPPAAQPPYEVVDQYVPYNEHGQTNLDLIFKDPQYKDFKVSYCALLLDPRTTEYDWVHKDLRETIFKCLYHKPDDRPSLQELLQEAEKNTQLEFPGETDEYIKEWIQYWFFDATADASWTPPSPIPPLNQPPPPTELPMGTPSAAASQTTINDALLMEIYINNPEVATHRLMPQLFAATFPFGWSRVVNNGHQLRCGLLAVADSVKHQLGYNPTINGVTYHFSTLPSADRLQEIHQDILRRGDFDSFIAEGLTEVAETQNYNATVLGAIVVEWGRRAGIEVELGVILQGYDFPTRAASTWDHPRFIWIYNDNAQEIAMVNNLRDADQILSHFEGMRPKPPPTSAGAPDGDKTAVSGFHQGPTDTGEYAVDDDDEYSTDYGEYLTDDENPTDSGEYSTYYEEYLADQGEGLPENEDSLPDLGGYLPDLRANSQDYNGGNAPGGRVNSSDPKDDLPDYEEYENDKEN
ncbi:putative serine threonine protein kinase protein [Rosellinia necatrix]|uniref:Putative serine threonine protein kinase protein n=1 Tax=Rosellinia necatrix TaxID=77044 RepID=A0A1W2TJ45_ROSNE|nr:putative serine threonine protein kinase protein [Rosellinia necatrix]